VHVLTTTTTTTTSIATVAVETRRGGVVSDGAIFIIWVP